MAVGGPEADVKPRAYGYAALREITDGFQDVLSTFTVGDVAGLLVLPTETDPVVMQRVATWLSRAPRTGALREQHLWIVVQLAAGCPTLDDLVPSAWGEDAVREEAIWAAGDEPEGARPACEVLRVRAEAAADLDAGASDGEGRDDQSSEESESNSDAISDG